MSVSTCMVSTLWTRQLQGNNILKPSVANLTRCACFFWFTSTIRSVVATPTETPPLTRAVQQEYCCSGTLCKCIYHEPR